MGGGTPRARAPEAAPLLDALLRGAPPAGGRRKGGAFPRLQHAVVAHARAAGRLRGRRTLAVDSTALDARYASTYYRYRYSAAYQQAYATLHGGRPPAAEHWRPRHPKLSVAADAGTHLILAAVPAWGPENDLATVAPVLTQAVALAQAQGLTVGAVVADAGYDAERVHALCRETLGIPATAIRLNPKLCGRRGPRGPYRRRMYTHFPRALYRQRPQVESVFSRLKRRLGAALTARQPATQHAELLLRVLTHNLLLLLPVPTTPFNKALVIPQERAQRASVGIAFTTAIPGTLPRTDGGIAAPGQ